ncbi:cupin domain-containing protein [Microbacterium gorillae]|uniref:cupin domain-containing protein n=1 Tax=Microbacterium gorillae TaxID=1231063 RepID=UPI00058D4ACE|nr:cupin domain-containing protein [Microbacterium gorillae]
MDVFPLPPTRLSSPAWFTGEVYTDVVLDGVSPSIMRAMYIRFAPGARTAWHNHGRGQTLHVTEGRGLIQTRDGLVTEINAGDIVQCPPGEWHWHGAAPDSFMTHLALYETPGEGDLPDEIGDLVTDDEFNGPRARR